MNGYAYDNSCTQFHMEHSSRIERHYAHAIEKHPYFCDRIVRSSEKDADRGLEIYRSVLEESGRVGDVKSVDVIQCELWEAVQAYAHGNISHAVEECYDTIAVLLRTIDVLEGRQKLGKPETNL